MKRTRTNWTKKATILLAAICVALVSLSSFAPARAQDWLLQVEGVPISRAMYSYFLSQALKEAKRKPDGRPEDMAALRRDTAVRCVEYIAINSELRAMEIPVDQVLKSEISDRIAFYWQVFGGYYKSIGVDKQTLGAAITGQAAKDQLFRALYDTGGKRAISEDSLDAYFYGNYVAYEGVRVYRTVLLEDGSEREMDIAETALLRQTLSDFVTAANDAEDFYGVAQEERFAEALGYNTPTVTVVKKGTGDVSDEDFEQLRGLSPKKISLLNPPGFFLVVTGVDMRAEEDVYYRGYRADCLRALKGREYAAALKELCKHFRADENVAAMDKFYAEWKW